MLTVDANKSEARAADVLVLPASLASLSAADLCVSEDGCPFKEEVQPYLLGRVSQLGAEAGPVGGEGVLMIDPEYDTYEAKLTFLSDSWLKYDSIPTSSMSLSIPTRSGPRPRFFQVFLLLRHKF